MVSETQHTGSCIIAATVKDIKAIRAYNFEKLQANPGRPGGRWGGGGGGWEGCHVFDKIASNRYFSRKDLYLAVILCRKVVSKTGSKTE